MIQKINFQRPTKIERGDGLSLLVHSVFYTVQGEGPNVGRPAVFVRLGGCNLQCPGCDTEYTAGSAYEDLDSLLTRVRMAFNGYNGEHLVVITGGEPFRQNIIPFANALVRSGHEVQVESNGTLGLPRDEKDHENPYRPFNPPLFSIVVSPKAAKVHPDLFPFITAYKYVLDFEHIDPRDGLPTSVLGMPAAPARPHSEFRGDIYVQPADEPKDPHAYPLDKAYDPQARNKLNMVAVLDSAMKFGYRVCLQIHKLLGVE
jgi:organic radical activating enzyme